ncbi:MULTISPECIES: rod shape-determining protein MreC [Actinomadura]|uniref:Cell shape-determining protein MreC n=1 Tax=Actinomadura litoris TaxID=2678616 RepID=A0A7K1L3K2_9ACTN|nr:MULTISPECIES: rod shape-determining protein MreC [Actinomadura]MBT2213560.1 rod shape-determining protein MreC [Actinomadura sp. NEAU-AAG7]MUN38940.1 rod shape-determining protein MreC [Actinomadura litoris]
MKDTRRTRVVLGALIVTALAMITVDYRGGEHSPLRGLRDVGAAVFGPVERASASVVRPVGDTFDAITDAPGERHRADRLERENQRLREQLRAGRLDQDRSAQLQRLLGTAGAGGYRIRAAQVISAGQGFEDTVTIDVGTRNGIRTDMTVMSAQGLVGRVTRVGPATATVLLATDQTSSIGSRLEDSKEIGIVQGRGRRGLGNGATPLRFQLLDAAAPMRVGQRVVTLGSQGERPYVPGVPIGVVERIDNSSGGLTRTAYVRPFVRFTSLDVVGVVVAPPRHDPRDAVLPPKPAPPPTPTPAPTGKPSPGASPSGDPAKARPRGTKSPHPRPTSED